MAKYRITKIYLVNGEKTQPIDVDKLIMNDAHMAVYRNRVKQVLQKHKPRKIMTKRDLVEARKMFQSKYIPKCEHVFDITGLYGFRCIHCGIHPSEVVINAKNTQP